ncbi:MAG: helix-turn-helix transcriptional regulator [Clostridia bacterium]|nr:helix-turn-helix transcriptional regulator [Clostridia bacterium]
MTVYKRLRDLREDHDLTQQDIADLLKATKQQVNKGERGDQIMGIDKYIVLARYYGVSPDYLAGLTEEP